MDGLWTIGPKEGPPMPPIRTDEEREAQKILPDDATLMTIDKDNSSKSDFSRGSRDSLKDIADIVQLTSEAASEMSAMRLDDDVGNMRGKSDSISSPVNPLDGGSEHHSLSMLPHMMSSNSPGLSGPKMFAGLSQRTITALNSFEQEALDTLLSADGFYDGEGTDDEDTLNAEASSPAPLPPTREHPRNTVKNVNASHNASTPQEFSNLNAAGTDLRGSEKTAKRRKYLLQARRMETRCEGVSRSIKIMWDEAKKVHEMQQKAYADLENINFKLHQKVFILQKMLHSLRETKKAFDFPAHEVEERAERLARIKLATHLSDKELQRHKAEKLKRDQEQMEEMKTHRRRRSTEAIRLAETERGRRMRNSGMDMGSQLLSFIDEDVPVDFEPIPPPSGGASLPRAYSPLPVDNSFSNGDGGSSGNMSFNDISLSLSSFGSIEKSSSRNSLEGGSLLPVDTSSLKLHIARHATEQERKRQIQDEEFCGLSRKRQQHRASLFKESLSGMLSDDLMEF